MAKDVITRFKLETTGFDSKIKEAAKELSAYSKTATQAKEGFNQFTQANVDAARALGTMATSTTNAKDRAKELVGAFNDAAKAYNLLTKEQQQSDWAKALAGSLTQLQQRIKETKAEMQGLGDSMKGVGGGGIFSGLGSKMEGALAVFGGNLMTKAAGAVAQLGSEMADMVKQGIEMAKAGEGVRIAFERLGNGQILQGLREATHGTVTDLELMKATVKFNDFKLPVEELGTMLAFAQQKAKDTGQSVDYMVESITNGLGRQSKPILDNLGISAKEIEERMKSTGDFTKAVGAIIRDQMAAAGDYVETAADRAAQANVSLQNKMEELGRKFAPIEEASNQLWTSMKIGILDIVGGPLARLLNGLTEAGRLKNALNDINGDGSGGKETRVEQALRMLREYSGGKNSAEGKKALYDIQVSRFQEQESKEWRRVNTLTAKRDEARREARKRGEHEGDYWVTAQYDRQIEEARTKALAYQQARVSYQKGAQDILNPKAAPTGTTTPTTKTTKKTKEEISFADDSIMAQEKLISDLTQKWKTASGAVRDDYAAQLDMAKAKLKEMQAVNVVPGSLQDYQNKLRDANGEVLTLREELLRMQKAGEDPVAIEVKQEQLDNAIEKVNSLQKDIDTLNGKTAEVNIAVGIDGAPIGDTQMGEEMANGLSTSLVNAADKLDLTGFTTSLQQAMANGLGDMGEMDFSEYLDYMKEQLGDQISEKEWPALKMAVETGDFGALEEYLKKLRQDGTATQDAWKGAAGAVGQLGNALNSIEDPGAKAAGTVMTAVANAALGFANASKGPFTNPWEWIAFVASGMATMITMISTIHSATGYANGGIYRASGGFVPGTSYSGDNIPANGGSVHLDSGELILNHAQQNALANELEGGAMGNVQLEAVIGAEDIMLVTNNRGRRTGRGEYVQSNSRRG